MRSKLQLLQSGFVSILLASGLIQAQPAGAPPSCNRTLYADVVALDQPLMLNRLGSYIPGGMIYALARDVVGNAPTAASCDQGGCRAGQVQLRSGKRPRPIVLRMGVGDCLVVKLTNLVTPALSATSTGLAFPSPDDLQMYVPGTPPIGRLFGQSATRDVGFHVAGLELANPPGTPSPSGGCNQPLASDGSFAGANCSSEAAPGQTRVYKLYARAEGHYLVYSNDDSQAALANAGQQQAGLFGSVTVEPKDAEFYRSQVTQKDLEAATYVACGSQTTDCVAANFGGPIANMQITAKRDAQGKQLTGGTGGTEPLWTLTTLSELDGKQTQWTATVVKRDGDRLFTVDDHPVINYQAAYLSAPNAAQQPARTPVLSMLQPIPQAQRAAHGGASFEIVHSDLTAMITGPGAGRFPDYENSPLFAENPANPDRREPFREFTIHYHVSNAVVQPFPEFAEGPLKNVLNPGADAFGINYGMGGIGPEVLANRLKVGPEADCVECKFEEFFLSSWAVGDPAMLVDQPTGGTSHADAGARHYGAASPGSIKPFLQGTKADSSQTAFADPQRSVVVTRGAEPHAQTKATMAFFPDDPSNVYHSYMRDHVKFRISNVSISQPHVHHQHAHQWLQSPNSDNAAYLDSQMIIPGSTYTLEMVYNGSGNRNQTVGDSIFHCHFYPHFAAGMWSMWRVHDVFEAGTVLNANGSVANLEFNRALPDGEIETGTPIPALAPLPTLGMAPMPPPVKLVDHGTRAFVKPDGTGPDNKPLYRNPGYPFFVPGVAGHRPPHPPMDFAWEEAKPGVPDLDGNGRKKYLDGGLPRHLILGGQIVRDFYTRWDFSKDTVAYGKDHKYLAGSLKAFVLPENGTDIERAAMKAHSTRTHATSQPNGQPGAFILNGLPGTSGAPFARPDIDDNGNAVTNVRRYQAAVIQTDVVLNKDGWHYPQQRFLSLWNDVKPVLSGERPPEPLFFRANSGETVQYWHTNLVPSYYELDDFQVRTPTDIIGQHIHLVKFDVLASDGAANGFNYEDGTFSPDEVRDRIEAINHDGAGGLHEGTQDASGDYPGVENCLNAATPLLPCIQQLSRNTLTAKLPKSLSNILGDSPVGQNWLGAQTTIQLWETDPLINNQGRDRTLRTVFTHDHFGPSTHQNVGLYAGLLVEPPGSSWTDPVTGKPMYDVSGARADGGPTSWQANIRTKDEAESYREFALEFQDMQLAYTPQSRAKPAAPSGALFVQSAGNQFASDVNGLNSGKVPSPISDMFKANGIPLSAQATAKTPCAPYQWCITDPSQAGFNIGLRADQSLATFSAFTPDMEGGWADGAHALSPPKPDLYPGNLSGPYPVLIDSSPGVGTYSLNYRNEPVPLRVNLTPGGTAGKQTDLAFAFASLNNRNDPKLNVQPESCAKPGCLMIGSSGFQWPKNPLVPMVGQADPYTPLLRAYENDRIQIRTLVGAQVVTHPFMVHGLNWLYEPEWGNSGYKSLQGMGLSEHFEMLFRMPAPVKLPGTTFSDYLYAPSSGTSGITQGLWGLLRAYDGKVPGLEPLPNNVEAKAKTRTIGTCPEGAPPRPYKVFAATPQQLGLAGGIPYNSHGDTPAAAKQALMYVDADDVDPATHQLRQGVNPEPLILRARAGECIQITLINQIPANASPAVPALKAPFGAVNTIFSFTVSDADVKAMNASQIPTSLTQKFQQNGYPLTTPSLTGWSPSWTLKSGAATTYTLAITGTQVAVTIPALSAVRTPATSLTVGLHAPELAYNINLGDGTNVGNNQLNSTSVAATASAGGGSVALQWYAGNIAEDANGKVVSTPVEFGSIPLLPADPLFQAANGLVGALVVEPKDATWVVDQGTRASAMVTTADHNHFREFVLVLQNQLEGINGAVGAANHSVSYSAPAGINYRSEPQGLRVPPNAGGFQIPATHEIVQSLDECGVGSVKGCLSGNAALQSGFQHPAGTPGFTLIPEATSSTSAGTWQIQDASSHTYKVTYGGGRLSIGPASGTGVLIASVYATPLLIAALDGAGPKTNLVPLLSAVQPVIAPANAQITVMAPRSWSISDGIYSMNVSAIVTSGQIQTGVPLQITYTVNAQTNSVLFDFSKFESNLNSPNPRDPDTPIFCASPRQRVRFRVVQPGTDTDQMIEIHGHSWQQEPYSRGGLSIGSNVLSQQMGTQVISPNDRLDLVLDSAGGAFGVPGDYLYHTFLYQMSGMWGVFRVLPPGQDPTNPAMCRPQASSVNTTNQNQ